MCLGMMFRWFGSLVNRKASVVGAPWLRLFSLAWRWYGSRELRWTFPITQRSNEDNLCHAHGQMYIKTLKNEFTPSHLFTFMLIWTLALFLCIVSSAFVVQSSSLYQNNVFKFKKTVNETSTKNSSCNLFTFSNTKMFYLPQLAG